VPDARFALNLPAGATLWDADSRTFSEIKSDGVPVVVEHLPGPGSDRTPARLVFVISATILLVLGLLALLYSRRQRA
jgi:hypothetical protein